MNKLIIRHPVASAWVFTIIIFYWLALGRFAPLVIEKYNIFISVKTLFCILIVMMMVFPFVLYRTIPKKKMSAYELFLNSILPVLIHYMFKVIKYNITIVIITLILIAGLTLGIYVLQKHCNIRKIRVVYFARHFVAFAIILLIIPSYLYYRYEKPTQEYISAMQDVEQHNETAMAENDLRTELHNCSWKKLSIEEKSNLLLKVVERESLILGIRPPVISVEDLESQVHMGTYNHDTQTITLNSYHLGSSDIVGSLNTVLHELYHSYQHSVIDIMKKIDKNVYGKNSYFLSAESWMAANESYIDDRKTPGGYENNALEVDARAYAYKTVFENYGFDSEEE